MKVIFAIISFIIITFFIVFQVYFRAVNVSLPRLVIDLLTCFLQ